MVNRKEKEFFYWINGDIYGGGFVNDKKEGNGIYIKASGKRYEGKFKNDKPEGKGISYYEDGRYAGDFKNDKKKDMEFIIIIMVIE